MNDRWDNRRKKLRFRAWRRGFREIDLILGAFADRKLAGLDEAGLDAFEALLDASDQDVYAWITEEACAPASYDTPTLASIRAFRFEIAPPKT
jgi:antitoxin CptB